MGELAARRLLQRIEGAEGAREEFSEFRVGTRIVERDSCPVPGTRRPARADHAEFAGLFPRAEFVVQPAAGHYPWLDDADRFVRTTARFLN